MLNVTLEEGTERGTKVPSAILVFIGQNRVTCGEPKRNPRRLLCHKGGLNANHWEREPHLCGIRPVKNRAPTIAEGGETPAVERQANRWDPQGLASEVDYRLFIGEWPTVPFVQNAQRGRERCRCPDTIRLQS